jgi:poly-gamma-glutamate capsule biosynthesis protein CapA/YwtB (metallophosphatase superfamily)
MNQGSLTLLGVSDILIDCAEPETIFRHVAQALRSADTTFANCEQTYSDPRNIPTLFYAGLDVISLANNHTMDWGAEGLPDTLSGLKEAGMPFEMN